MDVSQQIDQYIDALPLWQQEVCRDVRRLIHEAAPDIVEEIKFTNRPYFTLQGNVCALLATKDHVNVFIYDPTAQDPKGIINQGHANTTARSIQIYQNQPIDSKAFVELIREVVARNKRGGWRNLK